MNENDLAEELRTLIENVVEDYRLPVKNGSPRPPTVLNGYLPPKRSGQNDDYPFVLVRPESGNSEEEQTDVNVSIIIGCYTEEFDGHEYCLNIMQRIRTALTSLPNGILADKYVLNFPFTWKNYEDQPYPQWLLEIETKWAFNTPQPTVNYIDYINEGF